MKQGLLGWICSGALCGLFLTVGCNRDKSETVDTSMLSAPTAPQTGDAPSADSTGGQAPMADADMPSASAPMSAASSAIDYQLPVGWTQEPGRDMRYATLNGPDHVQIAITVFPGDVGGTLANINRWRKQMDLPAVTQDQLHKSTSNVPTAAGVAILADLSNHDQRMLGALLTAQNQTWVFKMSGSVKSMDKYAADFLTILKSVSLK